MSRGAWIAKWSPHSTVNIGTQHYTLGHEFTPQRQQILYQTQAQHLHFFHNSIWFIWFDTIICLSFFSFELWNRKLKMNKIWLRYGRIFLKIIYNRTDCNFFITIEIYDCSAFLRSATFFVQCGNIVYFYERSSKARWSIGFHLVHLNCPCWDVAIA